MDTSNLYINDFFNKLCRQRYDVHGTDLAQESLNALKDIIPEKDFQELIAFNDTVRNFEHLLGEDDVDTEDPKTIETTQKYENLVDNSNIYPENKAALYNTLLNYIDKNNQGNRHYLEVLRKKLHVTENGHDNELNLAAKEAFFHRHGIEPAVYQNTLHQAYAKMQNKERFTFLNELGLVLDKRGEKILSNNGLSAKQRSKRLDIIEAIVKHPLPTEMRISLLEEGLDLANNNNRSRSDNFELKRNLSQQLQQEYYTLGNWEKGNKHGEGISKWQRSIDLAMDYGHTRHKTND